MSDPPIRVFVADDHPMIRIGLAGLIASEPAFESVGEAANGAEAVRLIPKAMPHVVLMDLVMPEMDGIDATAVLHPLMPDTRFVILTSLVEPTEIQRAMAAGASGYLLKNASAQELVAVIRNTHAGRRMLAPEATDALLAATQKSAPGADLTQRERQLLALMAQGLSNQEIAGQMSIALPTVKFHITNILGKLRVSNRTEAVLAALRHKLIPPG